jgi:hypothetical protein
MFEIFIIAFVIYLLLTLSWQIIKSFFSFAGIIIFVFFMYIIFGGGK